jgi:ferritin-like metal-binding protein YciE
MSERTIDEQLTKYLTDAHSIEVQALAQMKAAPRLAGDEGLALAFEEHLRETAGHERRVKAALEARGADPSSLKDVAGRVGGWAMVAFARLNPDTPGKLTAHAFSYEHMELAAYELLGRVARRAGDEDVVALAESIGAEERAMGERLAGRFDAAVDASLREKDADAIGEELVRYLTDAHAIEQQAVQLLESGPEIARVEELAHVMREHLEETRDQIRLVEERLEARGASASLLEDAAMRFGGVNLGGFFGAQPDTPAKLAGFAYAFEHLEVAGYELLARVAERAGDAETAAVAKRIAAQERAAAERVAATWDAAVDATLADLTAV